MTLIDSWRFARGSGRKTVARLARRVLPRTTVSLRHIEPDLKLTVNLRRHVMFWSGGLNRFEPASVRVLRQAVRSGDAVFDVGANIGFFATLVSRWVGEQGRVIAIEPEPENLALLRHNLMRNRCENVTVCACAVGASSGLANFSMDPATGATGHLGESETAGEVAVGSGRTLVIETWVETIDLLVTRYGTPPRVLKMDIEGGELRALEGAASTLANHRPIVVAELTGDNGPAAVEFLRHQKYRMWDLESGRLLADDGSDPHHPFMVVAIAAETVGDERSRLILEALRPRR